MDPIYVCGHRNPDTDSIVSAMAYAALNNALGDHHYIAAMLGQPNDESRFLLERDSFCNAALAKNVVAIVARGSLGALLILFHN